MGRHSVDEGPDAGADQQPVETRAPGRAPVWADEPTVLVAGPGSRPVRPPRTRALVLAGGAVTLLLALLTLVLALRPSRPEPTSAPVAAGPARAATMDGVSVTNTLATTSPTPTSPTPTTSAVPTASPAPTTTSPSTVVAPGPVGGSYALVQSWGNGFIAKVRLTNHTMSEQGWQIVLEYPVAVTRYKAGWSSAPIPATSVTTDRSATITSGSPLPAGGSLEVFVQFDNEGSEIAPTRCTVNGAACA